VNAIEQNVMMESLIALATVYGETCTMNALIGKLLHYAILTCLRFLDKCVMINVHVKLLQLKHYGIKIKVYGLKIRPLKRDILSVLKSLWINFQQLSHVNVVKNLRNEQKIKY
jgi:hypothetical protein